MAHYVTRVRTPRPPSEVFAYLADLRNFAAWDPGIRSVTQVTGEGAGLGHEFDITVSGIGKPQTYRYRIVDHRPDTVVVAEASSERLHLLDRITVEPVGGDGNGGCIATYDATITLQGVARFADPLLSLAFKRIGDRAAAGLREALDGTAA